MTRLYSYAGPADIKARVAGRPAGTSIKSIAVFLAWVRDTDQRAGSAGLVTVTFIIAANDNLLVADRHSEHVACAGGGSATTSRATNFGPRLAGVSCLPCRKVASSSTRRKAGETAGATVLVAPPSSVSARPLPCRSRCVRLAEGVHSTPTEVGNCADGRPVQDS